MSSAFEEWKLILSSSAPLTTKKRELMDGVIDEINQNLTDLDLFELYRSVKFRNQEVEFYFIKVLIIFMDSSSGFSLNTIRSLIVQLNEQNKVPQIKEFIPSHIKLLFRDRTTLEINFISIFSQIKFYILLLVHETKANPNKIKSIQLINLCLDHIVKLLNFSIKYKKSSYFFEVLTKILTPEFKLFQILLSHYDIIVYEQFIKQFIGELIFGDFSFVFGCTKEIRNYEIYYLFTRLIVELFSEKLNIDFSLHLLTQFLEKVMVKFNGFKAIPKFVLNFIYFSNYLKTFNNFDQFFQLSTEIFDKNELTYDFLVTICEIIKRIENKGLIARTQVEHLIDFTKIFDFLSKFLVSANITKTFCSHCTNVKRHSIISYSRFYINYYRNLCKNNLNFCNEENLSKTVCIIKYNFMIWSSLKCPSAVVLFDAMFTLNYNLAITLSGTADVKLNETLIVISKILLKYITNNTNRGIQVDSIILTMLRAFNCTSKQKYLELYCFFVALQMQREDVDRNNLISHIQRIVQQFWTDNSYEIHPTFIQVLESIGDMLYEIPKPKYEKSDLLILLLETASNYRFRTNLRVNSLNELFQSANCNNYLKIGEFLSTYEFIDQTFVNDLTDLYDKLTSQTKNPLLLGLLKHKIFIVNYDKIMETKKSIIYDIDFENKLDMFDNVKLSSETKLVQHLFDSLDHLTKFIMKNFDNLQDLKYESLMDVLHSIGRNLYFRDYKMEATNAFGLLLAVSLELDYEDGIIDGLNYFLNDYKLYQMFLNYNMASQKILKLPSSLDDLIDINNNIIKKRGPSKTDRVLINYLNYSKYLIDLKRTDEFFKINKMFLKLVFNESTACPTNEIKYYHLKLILLIIYYKINNDNTKNNSFTIFKYIMNFFICFKNIKYTNLIERFEVYTLLFDTMEYLSDFIVSKRLFYEKDFYLLTIMKFALKVDAIKRLLSFLRFSIKFDILMETIGQINYKLTCFNRIVENKDCIELNMKAKNSSKDKESCNLNCIEAPKMSLRYECPSRNYNIHIDKIESITPLENFGLDFYLPQSNHQSFCNCFICNSDLKIRLFYFDICLLIGRLYFYRKQSKEPKEIFENGLSNLNYLKIKYKDTFEFTVNFEYYQLMKINLYEYLAHLHLLDKNYKNAKNLLLKAKFNYNLTSIGLLPIGYLQNILIQLKFVHEAIIDSKFILFTVIDCSTYYELCRISVQNENLKINKTNSVPATDGKKKRSPKLKCIAIKNPSSSTFDSTEDSTDVQNENKLKINGKGLDFIKEEKSENLIDLTSAILKRSSPILKTSKKFNMIADKDGLKPDERNKIGQSPRRRILRTRSKR